MSHCAEAVHIETINGAVAQERLAEIIADMLTICRGKLRKALRADPRVQTHSVAFMPCHGGFQIVASMTGRRKGSRRRKQAPSYRDN